MRGVAILDDQSTITMLDPAAVEIMGLQRQDLESETLSTTTVQGRTDPERCLAIKGIQVTGISREDMTTMDMPRTYLHGSFGNFNAEVPTRNEVLQMRGLEHYADRFMEDYSGLKPVMLIGRNCIWAQVQVQEISEDSDYELLAAETQLGMCIMGQIPQYPPGPYRSQYRKRRSEQGRRKNNLRKRRNQRFRQRQADQGTSGRQAPRMPTSQTKPLMDITFSNASF